jgi:type IV pilus assembly protein PilF
MRWCLRGLAVSLMLALLAACAGTGTNTGRPGAAPTPNGDSKDRVTASDESEASKRAQVRMELATAYFSGGQMTTALDQVKLAIAADPTFAGAYSLRGLIYANLGDDKLAEESFRRALQLNPRDTDAMQNFGYYLCQQKRYPEADALFEQALAVPQYRGRARTLLAQGVCYAYAGKLPESEATLARAYEADPANPSTSVNLAEVLYRRGDYERARFYIRRVNTVPALVSAQTLWLGARIENKLGNRRGVQEAGDQLASRFADSREAGLYRRGSFDD